MCILDFSGYRHFTISLSSDIAEISALVVHRESGAFSGAFYIDQMVASYNSEPDTRQPDIELLSADTGSNPGFIRLSARVTDNSLPIPKNRISLALDGNPSAFDYDEASSVLSASLPLSGGDLIRDHDCGGRCVRKHINCVYGP